MNRLNSTLSLLLLTAVLSACGANTAPPTAAGPTPGAAATPTPVAATPAPPAQAQPEPFLPQPVLPEPPAQAQVIESIQGLLSGEAQTLVTLSVGAQILAAAQADAAGHFTLPLPSAATLPGVLKPLSSGLLSELGCLGQLSSSDAAAQGYDVETLHTASATYMNAAVSQTLMSRNLRGRVYLYADRQTSLAGTLDCSAVTGLPTPVAVNLNVSKGWNVLELTLNAGLSLSGFTVKGQLNNGNDPLAQTSLWTNQSVVKAQMGS